MPTDLDPRKVATTYAPAIIATPVRAQLHATLDAIRLLGEASGAADAAYCADETALDETHPTWQAVERCDHAIDRLRAEMVLLRGQLRDADEPRLWSLREDGHEFRTLVGTRAEAVAEAEGCDDGDYGEVTETIWTDIHAVCEESDEHESVTVEIEPDAPRCEAGHDHDWQAPYEVLGGLAENPGVQGHGGGVLIREVCAHCGAYRITDTWAQRMDTGEQGLTSVAYEPADETSQAWVGAGYPVGTDGTARRTNAD